MLRAWLGAAQFCRARPVRAPPECQCSAHGREQRSFAVRAPCAHHRNANASHMPGAAQFCRARPVRAPPEKPMLRTCRAQRRAPLCGALCHVRKHSLPSGARTGRALQNGCALSHRRSDCLAICCRTVAQAARLWQSVKPRAARPLESQCFAHAGRSAARLFAERLQGAQAFTCQWGAHGARPAKRLRSQPPAKQLPRLWPQGRGASGPPLAKRETASGPATDKA